MAALQNATAVEILARPAPIPLQHPCPHASPDHRAVPARFADLAIASQAYPPFLSPLLLRGTTPRRDSTHLLVRRTFPASTKCPRRNASRALCFLQAPVNSSAGSAARRCSPMHRLYRNNR